MRMSCNGCRVLRKGCSEDCSIRPCLQWIKNSESQANATVFLAKFYGRAGLMNLINAGPDHLRPAIFRSLLYEACGRIVNPIYGSVGLLWSGNWQLCQAAVESVMKGAPITPINSDAAANGNGPPLRAYDIRHVSKDENSPASSDFRTRCRVKRSAVKPDPVGEELNRDNSHESSESMISVETAEASVLVRPELESGPGQNEGGCKEDGPGLELTLGIEPMPREYHVIPVKKRRRTEEAYGNNGCDVVDPCKMELGFQ